MLYLILPQQVDVPLRLHVHWYENSIPNGLCLHHVFLNPIAVRVVYFAVVIDLYCLVLDPLRHFTLIFTTSGRLLLEESGLTLALHSKEDHQTLAFS